MRNTILIMKRTSMAQALIHKMEESGLSVLLEQNYENAKSTVISKKANAVIVEAAEDGQYNISYCLMLCRTIRKADPKCKILLLCPEQNKDSISKAIQAKQNGFIDDFVFYDTSLEYLVSKLLSL